MKKIIFLAIVSAIVFACSNGPETVGPIDDPTVEPVGTPAAKVYFSNYIYQSVGVLDLKKTGEYTDFLNYEQNGLGIPAGIAINPVSKRLYITEQNGDGGIIHRINLDSTLYKVVYDSDNDLVNPTAVAVDTISKKLYWADSGTGQIMQGDLFGSEEQVALFNGEAVFTSYCYGLAIDHKNNKLYFADNVSRTISVGNLDGTGQPTIVFDENNADNVGCPSGLLYTNGNLYWADDCFNSILMAPADGKVKPVVLFGEEDGVSFPEGIAIDKASKKIYWSEIDARVIARGNQDGTGDREVILESIDAYAIALDFE